MDAIFSEYPDGWNVVGVGKSVTGLDRTVELTIVVDRAVESLASDAKASGEVGEERRSKKVSGVNAENVVKGFDG